MTEEELGENIRDACNKLGWRFLWLRKTQHSSAGILDLTLIPQRDLARRRTLLRELKGYDRRTRLGKVDARPGSHNRGNDGRGRRRGPMGSQGLG
jgi:hypothetical protein